MALREKFESSLIALKEYFDPSRQSESASNPGQLVLFAEHAVKHGHADIAEECLQVYFSLSPPTNQFLVRAHLCHALVLAPTSPTHQDRLCEALCHVTKAVDIARKSDCYHFLVYNASVVLWQVCRPFQRPGSRFLYCKALQTVVRALEDGKEQDFPWRLELLLGLVHSQVDGGLREEATKSCSMAAQIAKKHVPSQIVDVLKLQAYYQLGEVKALEKEVKASPELSVLSRLYRIKSCLQSQTVGREDLSQKLRRVFTQITGIAASDEVSTPRKAAASSSTPVSTPSPAARPGLLLELACVCVENRLTSLTQDCIEALPQPLDGVRGWTGEARLVLVREFVQCQLMVQQLGELEESYVRSAVEVRLKAIERMEEALKSALGANIPEITQQACTVLWNLSLPLLQRSLSHHLMRPLTAVATALEDISSLLHGLRCGVHLELARITAEKNQLQTAIEHLQKASCFDHDGEYREQIDHLQHRLVLRAQLYQTPDMPEDGAAQIIEQVSSSLNGVSNSKGRGEDLRSLLVRAGDLLAPDCFVHTLARPSTSPEDRGRGGLVAGRGSLPELRDKGRRLGDYQLARQQVEEHAKVADHDRDKERCRLWADLAKTARKQEVWDVAQAAAKFCLLYDDARWSVSHDHHKPELQRTDTMILQLPQTSSHLDRQTSSPRPKGRGKWTSIGKETAVKKESSGVRSARELLRTMAEVHCVFAECLVYQLQQDGLNLGDAPTSSAHLTDSGDSESMELWQAYCEWVSNISSDVHKSFLRAAELGSSLGEAWLVANVSTYLWNYSHDALQRGRLTGLVDVFRPLLASVKQVKLQSEPALVCRVCTVLAGGLVQKWKPSSDPSISSAKPATGGKKGAGRLESRMGGKKGKGGGGGGGDGQLLVDPEAGPDLKEALEVCEYGMKASASVPVSIRAGLLATWVQCKQLLQQPIPSKTYGIEEDAKDLTVPQCRSVVAVEMSTRMGNKIWDFPSCPTLEEVLTMVSECTWQEVQVELELWTRMAGVALRQTKFEMACKFANKAIEAGKSKMSAEALKIKPERNASSFQRVERDMLSLASSLLGQSLVANAGGNTAAVRRALEAFLLSARYGHQAQSYARVLDACQRYWNACCTLVDGNASERQLLQAPLSELLSHLADFSQKRNKDKEAASRGRASVGKPEGQHVQSRQDLSLQVAMYKLVFQAYTDRGQWEEGLKAIEDAMWVTPRAIHRDLAQQKLVFKSKMGKSVEGDMVRFQEEPEEFIACLWYKAACSASDPHQQLKAYQTAIDTLQSPCHTWQKVDYILELGEWLYTHQFPPQDALDQLHWATGMLISLPSAHQGEEGRVHPEGEVSSADVSDPDAHMDVRQLEALMRVQVMMAQLCGRGCPDYQAHTLSALGYCSLMWKQTFDLFCKSDKGKAAAGQLPETVEQWAQFVVSDELKGFIESSSDAKALNRESITKPTLTVYYLQILSDQLLGLSLHPLILPVLCLQLALAEGVIESRPLTQLAHLRISSTCLAVGLEKAAEAHREKAGPSILNPEDIAKSQCEIELHKSQLELIERETSKGSAGTGTSPPSMGTAARQPRVSPASIRSELPVHAEVVLRDVWLQEAQLMIQEGQYQSAYDLLHQAQLSAKAFGDGRTLVGVLLGLASLSLAQKDITEATNLIVKAQTYPSTLDRWLEGILLLCEAYSMEDPFSLSLGHAPGLGACVETLEYALELVGSLGGRQRSERARVEHTEALLKARLAVCRVQMLFTVRDRPRIAILEQCELLATSSRRLLELGYRVEAAQVMVQHAGVLGLGKDNRSEYHHRDLLQALTLYEEAAGVLQCVLENATTLCQPSECVSLPVQRELVAVQLCVSELLMEIFAEHSTQSREARTSVQQKSSVEKMIDEYVREAPVLSATEQEWENTASVAVEKALTILASALNLCGNCKQLRAKCIYATGHTLRLLSEHASPDPPLHWADQEASGSGRQAAAVLGSGGEYSTLSTVMRTEEATQAELEESFSLEALTQACQCLAQALSLALEEGDIALAKKAALELVNCFGSCDPASASLYLALYQSCAVSEELLHLLTLTQTDPSSSQLASLLEQNARLRARLPLLLPSTPPSLAANVNKLNDYEAWRRLEVAGNHLELLKAFPSHFRFVVLQHSPNRSQLYTAYLIPPQPPPPASKKGQPPPQVDALEPAVSCVSVCTESLDALLELAQDHRESTRQKLLKSEVHVGSSGDETQHHSLLPDLVAAMEAYLSEALKTIGQAMSKEDAGKELVVVLLADSSLLSLPLEALSILQGQSIASVSRDFSMQMLHHRMATFITDEGEKAVARGSDKFHPQPTSVLGNVTNFRYILDPRNDLKPATGCDDENPSCKITAYLQTFPKLTAKWSGLTGQDHSVSEGEWTPLLKECSGLLFFGSERFLAHFPPQRLASVNMKDCSIGVVMDHMQTTMSALVQSKVDLEKSPRELELEHPLQTALLLSLVGISCVVANQWSTTVASNTERVISVLKGLLSGSNTIGSVCTAIHKTSSITQESDSSDNSGENKRDFGDAFNCVLYGLPHITLMSQ